MNLQELKEKLDDIIGLDSNMESKWVGTVNLEYLSSTDVVLFNIEVADCGDDGWQFAGTSGALPDMWKTLCRAHEDKQDTSFLTERRYGPNTLFKT